VRPAVEHGVEQFMQKLSTSYASFFNHKYERVGSLYEGKFKSEWVDSDEYLKYLFSYIHLNPVKLIQSDWKEKGIQNSESALQYLEKYRHSSFPDFDEFIRTESKILDRQKYPNYFEDRENFRKEILEWINFNPKSIGLT
jgi:putative transposase